jgi:hypothetical protein
MTRPNRSQLRVVIGVLAALASAVICARLGYRFMYSKDPNASIYELTYFSLAGGSVIVGFVRYLRRNKRNRFEEEMAHRRSLVSNGYRK